MAPSDSALGLSLGLNVAVYWYSAWSLAVAAVRSFLIDRLSPEQIRQLGDIGQLIVDGLTDSTG